MKYVRRNFEPKSICYLGSGGGQTSQANSTHADTTTTSQSATGTVGTVNNIAAGATSTTTDFGAINAAGNAVQAGIAADQANVAKVLDVGSNETANAINLVNNTETGAADLISKAIGLAAATGGQNASIVSSLSSNVPAAVNPATSTGVDINLIAPIAIAGVVAYFIWRKL